MKVIGKGEDAFNSVMEEIEAMFEMDTVQRDCVEQALFKMTEHDTKEYTYKELYDEVLSKLRIFGQPMTLVDYTDGDGNPDGGWMESCGLQIRWQRGALDFEEDVPWNGLFLVTLLEAAQRRLEYYQSTKFECEDNAEALDLITASINVLNGRQIRRFCEGSRGKHEEDE